MGDGGLPSPSAANKEADWRGIGIIDPSLEIVERLPPSALKTSLARIESCIPSMNQVEQAYGRTWGTGSVRMHVDKATKAYPYLRDTPT